MGHIAMAPQAGLEGAASAEEIIGLCFADVLGLTAPSPDEDFFAWGGDSVAAVELALRLNEALGLSLPMTAAFDAPTIRTLAELCRRHAGEAEAAPLLLRPGSGIPVFLFPGASGIGAGLRRLAQSLEGDNPVYGFDYPGLYGRKAPLDRVPDLAAYLLPALRAAAPEGPLILGGYSVGGLVAYDIARRLAAQGRMPRQVILIDSPISREHLSTADLLRIWRRRLSRHWRAMRRLRPGNALGYGAKRAPAMLRDLVPRKSNLVVHQGSVSDAGALAARRYDPPAYDGHTVLLWCQGEAEHNALDIVWRRRAPDLTVLPVPGRHADALGSGLAATAQAISAVVAKAGAARVAARHAQGCVETV